MPHFGTLRDYKFKEDVEDVRGAKLYGADDEKLGTIDDVVFDHSQGEIRYVVVDTGGWLSSKKFLVPADRIHAYQKDTDEFQVDLLKEHIERFPPYDENALHSETDWEEYERRYGEAFHAAPVMHRRGSDRVITPDPEEVVGRGQSVHSSQVSAEGGVLEESQMGEDPGHISEDDLTPARLAGKFPSPQPGGSKLTMRPAGTAAQAEDAAHLAGVPPAGRWSRFEQLLERNRSDIQSRCSTCCSGDRKAA
jgi:sporulation protein YlmC with PRC-barrel domain